MKKNKKILEKIIVDRKVVEYLAGGHSLTGITKSTKKGKGYVIKIKDLALEYGFIEPTTANPKVYKSGSRPLPLFPEALFPLKDGRSEKLIEIDEHLLGHKKWIEEKLELSWSPQTVFEELPIAVPRASFYRYLHRHKLMSKDLFKNIPEIITAPGESLQIDWGKLCDVDNPATAKKKVIWIFIGTLGHSRYRMVRVVERGDTATTLEALISMLEEIGGVTKKVTSDNPKVFVTQASRYEPTLNAVYERFASYYDFTAEALPARTPELKGKVERVVTPIRRLFESYDFKNYTQESAQAHIDKKLSLHNERKHSVHGLKPLDVFLEEESALLTPLPKLAYELETITYSTIRADGYVRFDKKYYRVDPRLKKEMALVISNTSLVNIYCNGRLLECYERITDRYKTKACKDHYREPWEKTLEDHGHYIKRAENIGADVGRLINIILARGDGFVDTRVVWGILSLDKKYHKNDINKASRSAIELEQISYAAVTKLLRITSKQKKRASTIEEKFNTANGKYSRPMSEYKSHLRIITNNPKERK